MQYAITKPAPSVNAYAAAVCLLLAVLTVLLILLFVSARNCKLEVSNGRLSIRSFLYGTDIELSRVDAEGLRLVDLKRDNLSIRTRSNGVGLPGLYIGWFSGEGGRYKLYVTDREKVLLIPTAENYTILFSTEEGEEIIRAIRAERGNQPSSK